MSDQGPNTIPVKCKLTIPKEVYEFFESVQKYIPGPIMAMIISSKPDDDQIEIVEGGNTSYAWWKKHTVVFYSLKGINWKKYMGWIRDQGPHNTCWAIVVAELISALRFILKYDATYTDYSAQYLVDYADQAKGLENHSKEGHYCYTHSIAKGLEFVKHGCIPLAKHWKYVGCRKPPAYSPPKDHSHVRIASVQRRYKLHEALPQLQFHPIGASLAIFQPDYQNIKKGKYRGPMSKGSIYKGLHAVSIYGIVVEDGETIALVKSSHGEYVGDDGYFKVSLDIMVVEVPWEGKEAHPNFKRPRHLLTGFCFPELLPREVEQVHIYSFE